MEWVNREEVIVGIIKKWHTPEIHFIVKIGLLNAIPLKLSAMARSHNLFTPSGLCLNAQEKSLM